jgi:hypothetical protein
MSKMDFVLQFFSLISDGLGGVQGVKMPEKLVTSYIDGPLSQRHYYIATGRHTV